MKKKISIQKLVGLNLAILVPVLFIVIIAATTISSQHKLVKEVEKSAEHLRDASILKIENKLQDVEICVKSVSGYLENTPSNSKLGYALTNSLVMRNPTIVGSAIAYRPEFFEGKHFYSPYAWEDEKTGEVKTKQLGTQSYDYFSMEWYNVAATTGKPHWSEPYMDEGGGGYLMTTFSCPAKDEQDEVFAVVTADVKLEDISAFLATIKPYPSSFVSLVDKKGNYLNIDQEDDFSKVKIINHEDNPDGTGKMTFRVGNKRSFVVFGPLSNGWTLFISCDYDEILARSSILNLALILLALIGLAVIFARSYLALKKYIENLKETTAVKQRIESELTIASDIQMAMLPTDFPHSDKVDLYALLKPAREVGGDFYDFFIKDNTLIFAVGDVSGKGIPASMFMAVTRSAFHYIAGQGKTMNDLVLKINDALCDGNKEGMFVTMFVGSIDLDSGEFSYCNAGHNPIIVNGEYLKADANLAVGLFEGFPYTLGHGVLPKGSHLLIYTDGVTEAERADKSEYGESRLIEKIAALGDVDSERVCDEIYKDVQQFAAGNDQNDDITIMNIILK